MIGSIERIVKPNKLAEQIAARLRLMIANGELQPRDKLPTEKELCDAFGVGRSSVREALQSLEHLGLVESRPGIGRYLNANAPKLIDSLNWGQVVEHASVFELMEVRRFLEVLVAQFAAERASEETIRGLDESIKQMEKTVDDADAFLSAELGFHLLLSRACGNSVLTEIVSMLIQRVSGEAESFLRTLPYTRSSTLQQFGRLMRALREGDSGAAGNSMLEHLSLVRDVLTTNIERT